MLRIKFPTGAFLNTKSKETRILPTEFIDLVTQNKHGELSIVELKLNDSQLEVMSQLLDYSLFFACYHDKLAGLIQEKLGGSSKKKKICCYVANNYFHPKFDSICRLYSPRNNKIPFSIKKITLGHTEIF